MYNQKIRGIIYKYERLQNMYDIGPVHKCVLEDFVEEIVEMCANAPEVPNDYVKESIRNVFKEEKIPNV